MNDPQLDSILRYQGYGFAGFSSELKLVSWNPQFEKFCKVQALKEQAKISDVIPETFGLDETLKNLGKSEKKYFSLENINRKQKNHEIFYYDLFFYPYPERQISLLCLVKNVTVEARQRQQINQQKYEISLLESLLVSRRGIIKESYVGNSEAVQEIKSKIEKVSKVPAKTVLIQGELGTGKKLVGRLIHFSSESADAPFIEVQSSTLTEQKLGYRASVANKDAADYIPPGQKGILADADGGTLFLDDVEELPPNLQICLVDFLETGKIPCRGGLPDKKLDVRLIAATRADLKDMVEKARFREDLYYRFNSVVFSLPPLRDLGEDILTVAHHYMQIYNAQFKKRVKGFTPEAEQLMLSYPWPGNVRELANCIERAMIFTEGELIGAGDLTVLSLQR